MFKELIFDQPQPEKESESVISETTVYFIISISKEALNFGKNLKYTTIVKKIPSTDINTSIDAFTKGELAPKDTYRNFIVKLGGITKYWYENILSVHSIEFIDYQPKIVSIRQEVTKEKLKPTLDYYYKETPGSEWILNNREMVDPKTWLFHGRLLQLLGFEKIVSLPQLLENFYR